LAFKKALDRELKLPYVLIPGDNWPWGFAEVFGAYQYSFDVGGLHFLFLAPDAAAGAEGCSNLAPATWQWLRRDLQANAAKPTLVFMHEPVVPPATLFSAPLLSLLKESPNVLATMAGHIHLDLEFNDGGLQHFLCPSVGLNARHGFKVIDVYPDRIVLETWEYDEENKRYQQAMKWQKIDIPATLRQNLRPVTGKTFRRENYTEIPPHPRKRDQSLTQYRGNLMAPMFLFLMRFSAGSMFAKPAKKTAPATQADK
jgi:hypothetical protein